MHSNSLLLLLLLPDYISPLPFPSPDASPPVFIFHLSSHFTFNFPNRFFECGNRGNRGLIQLSLPMSILLNLQSWLDSSTHLHMNGSSTKAQWPPLVSLIMPRLVGWLVLLLIPLLLNPIISILFC